MARGRVLAAVLLALAGVAAVVAAAGAGGRADGEAAPRLPDLTVLPPSDLEVRTTVTASGRRRHRLAFTAVAENTGAGPLVIAGRREADGPRRMAARQLVAVAGGGDGDLRALPDAAGDLNFEQAEDHTHWHLEAFIRYELRRVRDRRHAAPDRKQGFCLGDRTPARRPLRRGVRQAEARYTSRCGLDRPGLTWIEEGISVGWADVYLGGLEGQDIDLARVPPGRYDLVHRVDPGRLLRQERRGNDASSVRMVLRRRAGRPVVRVVRRCPGRAVCAP